MILIAKSEETWSIITPDIEKIGKAISKISNNNVCFNYGAIYNFENDPNKRTLYVNMAILRLDDLLKKGNYYDIIGVTDKGNMYFLNNPINGAYEIIVNNKNNFT